MVKIDSFRELEQDVENALHSHIESTSDDFEGKDEDECLDLELDPDSNQGSEHYSESERMLQELTDGALPEVGHSPSEREPNELGSFFRVEAEGVDSTLQDNSNDARSDNGETGETIRPEISNEDIKTAQIMNTCEETKPEGIPESSERDNRNADDTSGGNVLDSKESEEEREDLDTIVPTTLADFVQSDEIRLEGDGIDASWSESVERNISVSELRLSSSPYNCDKPPAIETILESVIISSSFREDSNGKASRNSKKSKKDRMAGQKNNGKSSHTNSEVEVRKSEFKNDQRTENESYRVEEEKRIEEINSGAKEKDVHELEEKHAQLEIVEYEDSGLGGDAQQPYNTAGAHVNLPGKEVAVEEQQHEVRISDSYRLVDIASTLMTDDNDCWIEKQVDQGADAEFGMVEKFVAKISNFIEEGEFSDALQFLRKYRGCQDASGAVLDDNERDIFMILFAKSLMKNKTSVFALTNSLEDLAEVCDQLSECMTELLAMICTENGKRDS